MAIAGIPRPQTLTLNSLRQSLFMLAIFGMLCMVIIGLNPLSEKVKTIPATGDGDMARQFCYSLLFLIALVATQPIQYPARLFTFPASILVALVYCWITLSWSIVPSVGARRLTLTTIIIFTIFRSVREVGYDRTLLMMRVVLVITLVLNYVAIVVTPAAVHHVVEIGDPNLVGNWRGVLPQKNFAGAICAFTILIFLFDAKRVPALIRLGVILGSAYFLYRTSSKTSMGILAFAIGAGGLHLLYKPAYRVLVLPAIVLIAVGATLYVNANWDAIIAPFNTQDALTGRVQIWPPLLNYANDHWLTGSGYGSFWNIGPYSPIYQYGRGWVAGIASGHNGYIDLLIQIGFPGLIIVIMATIIIPLFRLLFSSGTPRTRGALLVALLIFCTGHNLTESSLFDRDMAVHMFMMFTVALIDGETLKAARRAIARKAKPYAGHMARPMPAYRNRSPQ